MLFDEEVEAAAAVIARETYHWTDAFRLKMKWPDDLSEAEQLQCRRVATLALLEASAARRKADPTEGNDA